MWLRVPKMSGYRMKSIWARKRMPHLTVRVHCAISPVGVDMTTGGDRPDILPEVDWSIVKNIIMLTRDKMSVYALGQRRPPSEAKRARAGGARPPEGVSPRLPPACHPYDNTLVIVFQTFGRQRTPHKQTLDISVRRTIQSSTAAGDTLWAIGSRLEHRLTMQRPCRTSIFCN